MSLVTVIIPTKNRSEYLKEALASLVPNKCQKEILVIDDNSTEDEVKRNRQIVDAFQPILNCYLINSLDVKAPGECLNPIKKGIANADGEYIKIIGDDDFLEPYTLDNEVDLLDRYKYECDAILTSYACVNERLEFNGYAYKLAEFITIDQMRQGCFVTDYMLTKKTFWEDVEWKYDIGSRWLWHIWMEMLYKGLRIQCLPDKFWYRYRQNPTQISKKADFTKDNDKMPALFEALEKKYKK